MSEDQSGNIERIRLFLTEPHPCSYLSDRVATTSFADPTLPINPQIYNQLTLKGFRRSGNYFYTPACHACQRCQSARIEVADFKPNRNQRRCLNRNRDIRVDLREQVDFEVTFALYGRYLTKRHRNGDMYPPTEDQYRDFIASPRPETRYLHFWLEDKLIGCAVTDFLSSGLSAIYTFFDPNYESRSLGRLAILHQIELTRRLRRPYLYLGYWIEGCSKMDYKTEYVPQQRYINQRWQDVPPVK